MPLTSNAKLAFKFQLFTLQCLYDNWPEEMERWYGLSVAAKCYNGVAHFAVVVITTSGTYDFKNHTDLANLHDDTLFHAAAAELARTVATLLSGPPTPTDGPKPTQNPNANTAPPGVDTADPPW